MNYLLKTLLTPQCWIQNYEYNPIWDTKLRSLIKEHTFKLKSNYTATLGGHEIWIGNHPYASFTPYSPQMGIRPSRRTIFMAYDKLIEDVLNSHD